LARVLVLPALFLRAARAVYWRSAPSALFDTERFRLARHQNIALQASGRMAKMKLVRSLSEQSGKSLREKCPRLSHAKVIRGQGKKRDIVALIKASNEGRLENLIPIRY
jgi:hypothetical protein